jgi:hypothetical protein
VSAIRMVAAVVLCDGVIRCVKFSAAIVFAGFAAGPARGSHEDPKVRRDLVHVAEMKGVLRHAIKCQRWTLYRHYSHALPLCEQGSKLTATFVITARFLEVSRRQRKVF